VKSRRIFIKAEDPATSVAYTYALVSRPMQPETFTLPHYVLFRLRRRGLRDVSDVKTAHTILGSAAYLPARFLLALPHELETAARCPRTAGDVPRLPDADGQRSEAAEQQNVIIPAKTNLI